MKVTKLGQMAYLLGLVVVVADQVSKYWVLEVFHLQERVAAPLLGPIGLHMVWNKGVSFGLLWADKDFLRWGLAVFSIGVSVLLAFWVRNAVRPLMAAALGLIMGGAVGNVIDRIRFGAVADFIDVTALHFPWVFNVADAGINVGIALLLLDMFVSDRKPTAARATDAA